MAINLFSNDIQFAQVVNIAEGEDAILIGGVVIRFHPDSQRHVSQLVTAMRSMMYYDRTGSQSSGALIGNKAGCAQSVGQNSHTINTEDYVSWKEQIDYPIGDTSPGKVFYGKG